jgi:tight adherence protein B
MDGLTGMIQGNVNFQYGIGLVAVFVGIFLLCSAISHYVIEPMRWRRQINQRLKSNKREEQIRAQIFKAYKETQSSAIVGFLNGICGWNRGNNLQAQLLQADIYLAPNTFIIIVLSLLLAGFFLGTMMGKTIWSVGLGLGLGFLPIMFLRWKKRRKTAKFEKYMPEAMELLSRSLKAGHTLQATLELVSQEIPAPLGTEMRVTYEEQRLGLSVTQAFRRMAERVASRDLQIFVTAVLIQTESGGNLAEILENIGLIIRERLQLKSKIQGLTAEGRFSAIILVMLPVVTFLALLFLNPKYIMTLFSDPAGTKFLYAGALSDLLGIIVIKKMINLKT